MGKNRKSKRPTMAERLAYAWRQYLPSLILIWLALLFYRHAPYYAVSLTSRTQDLLLFFGVAYTALAPIFYLLIGPIRGGNSRAYLAAQELRRIYRQNKGYLKAFRRTPAMPKFKPSFDGKVSLLFILVKIFFLPIMINSAFANFDGIRAVQNSGLSMPLFSAAGFNDIIFPLSISLLLLIDTTIFSVSYAIESRFLRNKVKSVEPTMFGWAVALVSYPPFNSVASDYVGGGTQDQPVFHSMSWTVGARIVILVLYTIYVAASVALGFKASNLTNRGIVGYGPYHFIRHPAYASKTLVWWIGLIPVFSLAGLLSMLFWTMIYFFRALTEERHLIRDPAYQAYCRKVKYRFIPRVI